MEIGQRAAMRSDRRVDWKGPDGVPWSHNIVPSWHLHAKILFDFNQWIITAVGWGRAERTTVIGMLGALGKMKDTSSNLPRLR